MAEPGVPRLDERLANDLARLGVRGGTQWRRTPSGADVAAAEDRQPEGEDDATSAGPAADLPSVHEVLQSIIRRLDRIEASLVEPHGLEDVSVSSEIVDRLDRLDLAVQSLGRLLPTAGGAVEAGGAAEVRRLVERIDSLGELLVASSPGAPVLSADTTLRSLHREVIELLDASATTAELLRAQQAQLTGLTAAIEALKRNLGV